MQRWAIILFLFVALAFWARAQEIVVPVPAGTPLPSSIRASVPTSATSPGMEGQIAMDAQALYSYHGGRWAWSPRLALPVPTPAPATSPTPTP